ncbi:MAG: DMT family transporter [Candidatus Acidiferrales bacterium]
MLSKRLRADLALAFCSLIWGSTFVVVKDALADVSVFAYIAVRFTLAAALMGILYWRSLRQLDGRTVWAGVQIGFFMLGGYVFQTAGLKFTTPSKAAFITGSSVVLVPVLLAALAWRRLNAWIWSGALAALVGLYLLTVPAEGFGGFNRGDPLVFVCSVMFALHIIFIGRYVGRSSVGSLALLQVATTAVASAILLSVFATMGWEHPRIHWTGQLLFAVLITAIGSTVIGFSLQVWAQQHTSPSHTALLISLEPVFAALTSWLFAHERLGPRILLGAILILAGILLAELKGPAPAVPESPEPFVRPVAGE